MSFYLPFDVDAMKLVPQIARAHSVTDAQIGWGLLELWRWCWTGKKDVVTAPLLRGFFGSINGVSESLVAFGFLEPTEQEFRVRGAEKFLRIRTAQSESGKKHSDNLKRGRKPPAISRLHPEEVSGSAPALTPNTYHLTPKEKTTHMSTSSTCISPKDIQEAWNKTAEASGLPTCQKLTGARKIALKYRLKDTPELTTWESALKKIQESSFLKGNGNGSWRANFDWFIKPDTIVKILEGKYDGGPKRLHLGATGTDDEFRAAMANVEVDENGDVVL